MTLDWSAIEPAAQSIVRDILVSENFQPRADGQTYVLAFSRISNDTKLRNIEHHTVRILRRALINSGRFDVTTIIGLSGPLDQLPMRTRELRHSSEVNQQTVVERGQFIPPEFAVSGLIARSLPNVGVGAQRFDYALQLTITDIRTGVAVWEGEYSVPSLGSAQIAAH